MYKGSFLHKLFERLLLNREKQRLQRSLKGPFVAGYGRDSVKYYENGRSAIICGEAMFGGDNRGYWWRIYTTFVRWDDNRQDLTPEEKKRALAKVCEYFDQRKVKFEIHDGTEKI